MIMYVQQNEPLLIKAEPQEQKISRKRSRSQLNRTTSEAAPQTKKRRVTLVKKSVGFKNFVEIISTPSSSGFNDWYHDADAMQFRANVKRDVLYLAKLCKENRVREMDQTEYCTVGIERYCCTPATRAQAKALKDKRIKAVVEEQRMQKVLGTSDPEAIRALAEQYSQQARDRALQLAARLVQ